MPCWPMTTQYVCSNNNHRATPLYKNKFTSVRMPVTPRSRGPTVFLLSTFDPVKMVCLFAQGKSLDIVAKSYTLVMGKMERTVLFYSAIS